MDNAFKIQYLRVVLNFCDRDADNQRNKMLLLSKVDTDIMDLLVAGTNARALQR
jgi:hypothetical protein